MAKYKNPIDRVNMVKIPKWEYATLVAKATTLEIMQILVENDKKYTAADLMELLMVHKEEEE